MAIDRFILVVRDLSLVGAAGTGTSLEIQEIELYADRA